jgi:hypothetical protein
VRSAGAWWIAYDSVYLGYFPDSHWDGRFTRGGLTQWFGEVASPKDVTPCSTMGNGLTGEKGLAARLGSITFLNGPELAPIVWETKKDYYSAAWTLEKSVHTVRYGGPGAPKATKDNPGC